MRERLPQTLTTRTQKSIRTERIPHGGYISREEEADAQGGGV